LLGGGGDGGDFAATHKIGLVAVAPSGGYQIVQVQWCDGGIVSNLVSNPFI